MKIIVTNVKYIKKLLLSEFTILAPGFYFKLCWILFLYARYEQFQNHDDRFKITHNKIELILNGIQRVVPATYTKNSNSTIAGNVIPFLKVSTSDVHGETARQNNLPTKP